VSREDLARRQADLVAALVGGGAPPPGFDPDRVRAAGAALLRKRAGEVGAVWPLLRASLGPQWMATFASFATGRPPLGSLRDGWDLARALASRGELPPDGARELADREAAWTYDGTTAPRPRRARPLRRLLRLRRLLSAIMNLGS
jgi:hypothetical protein